MIKVTYYIGMNDKDVLQQIYKKEYFINEFDEVFRDYTILEAQSVHTMQNNGIIIKENTFILTTFVDDCEEIQLRKLIQANRNALKNRLNQESILVEVTEPGVIFC